MTTDTRPKEWGRQFGTERRRGVRIGGMAKGSGNDQPQDGHAAGGDYH